MYFENQIVIDNGSSTIRAGNAGDETPQIEAPNLVGVPLKPNLLPNNTHSMYLCNFSLAKRGVLSLKYPMEHGIIP